MAQINPGTEFKNVQATLERLAEAVVDQMRDLQTAASARNHAALEAIVVRDQEIDALEMSVGKICRSFMELRAPIGPDFRYVIGALDIARNLERIGDCIEYVARHMIESSKLAVEFPEAWHVLESMMDKCNVILSKAFSSWLKSVAKLARAIPEQDDFVDALQESAYSLIIKEVRAGKVDVELGMIVMLITNKLESIADIACHIAETVVFMILAKQIRHAQGEGSAAP
jgi:phosphate transport system protein